MQTFFTFLLIITTIFTTSQGITNYIGTDIQKCINCLCHARTSCYSRFNCARYSISFDYWLRAKSPVVDINDEPDSQASYQKCMRNENCIVATIVQYTNSFGQIDCNCDGQIDCKDRLAIHLFGENCYSPQYGRAYAMRFNHCAKQIGVEEMEASEGSLEGCRPLPV